MAASNSARRFAPLKVGSSSDAPKLHGVVFDMDGTLWLGVAGRGKGIGDIRAEDVTASYKDLKTNSSSSEPQNYMFGEMRAVLGITKAVDIIDHMNSLPAAEQAAAHAAIQNIERTAMAKQTPQPGLDTLMQYLDARGVPKAICTRNFNVPVDHLLGKFLAYTTFAPVITRDFQPPKPSPAGILHISKQWALLRQQQEEENAEDATGLIMVGDSIDDMTAGRAAGAATVLLVNEANKELAEHAHTDLVISRLDELVEILENGFQGRSIGN